MSRSIDGPLFGQSLPCETILRSLPDWFGIENSTVQYIKDVETLPTFICREGEQVIGFLAVKKHNRFSAEIHVVGVLPEHHRQGVGTAMLARAEEWLRCERIEFLQVKTIGLADPDPDYAKTRRFYEAVGFRPLEEFATLWGESLPCLQLVKKL